MTFSTVELRCDKVYRCGEVEICPARGLVQVHGAARHLRPKSFELLEYLIAHRNRLVAKNELLGQIWRDTAVNENAPAQCVIELRKALGDDARNPRFIKTISKLGYQFIGPIEESLEPEGASLELEEILTSEIQAEESSRLGWILVVSIFATLAALFFFWQYHTPPATLAFGSVTTGQSKNLSVQRWQRGADRELGCGHRSGLQSDRIAGFVHSTARQCSGADGSVCAGVGGCGKR